MCIRDRPKTIKNKDTLENGIDLSIQLISAIRSLRVEKNIPSKSRPSMILKNVDPEKKKIIIENKKLIINLAKLNDIKFSSDKVLNNKFIVTTVENITLMLPLEGLIDVNEEKNRLNKELTNINLEIDIINKRLNNPMFIEKAPSNVINEVKTKQGIYTQRKFEIEKALLNI